MITTDPSTWHKLEEHPSFQEFGFCEGWEEWYEGDSPNTDLNLLQKCALALTRECPGTAVNLTVLDDLTTFVEVSNGSVTGQFGVGCEPDSLYIQYDADSGDGNAPEIDDDNLKSSAVIQAFRQMITHNRRTN